ncbi:MAG: hypothetical protein FJY82_11655 [Candidatus Aminicenantes bacterium]|nr:hypothetical protein [Candidatus Aminicenantes bacterium]
METATIRIPASKKNILKAISGMEDRKMGEIIVDLIDDYIERHRETAEIMAVPGLAEEIRASSREFRQKKTVSLKDVRKTLGR